MIEYGRILWRGLNSKWINYDAEVEFCKKNSFNLMQITYKDGKLQCDGLPEPKEKIMLEASFPVIIHAIFEIADFKKYADNLLGILKYLHHNEVIIHPMI